MKSNSIGQFLAALRKASGMTQQEVADRLNVSSKAVSRWEREECAPDITVIPALAEMFGVTCDEIIRGERIPEMGSPEKRDAKVERQRKQLLSRLLSTCKTFCYIAIALAAVGLICMFGISYGFYRPVIGFFVMLLFVATSLTLTVLTLSRTKDATADNELFDCASAADTAHFKRVLADFSFHAFFAALAVVLLSLPLILVTSEYRYSVATAETYFTVFFGGVVLILTVVYLKTKPPYYRYITGGTVPEKSEQEKKRRRDIRRLNLIQWGLFLLACIAMVEIDYFSGWFRYVLGAVILLAMAGCVLCLPVMAVRRKEGRTALLLPGIRNILLLPATYFLADAHWVFWTTPQGVSDLPTPGAMIQSEIWREEYLILACGYCAALFVAVAVLDAVIKLRKKKKN